MPRIQPLHSHFSWGEMSPIMQGRANLPQVQASCQTLINWQVDSHGGIRRRLGTKYVAETKYPQLNSRLIPFIFSRQRSWVLEFGDYYIRFFRDGGPVINPGAVESYQGNGTGQSFFYPHPTVAHADIQTYLEPDFEVPTDALPVMPDPPNDPPTPGSVRYIALTAGVSYINDFRDADWTWNDFSSGAGATDVVSDGVANIASLVMTNKPISRGAVVDIEVLLSSVSYTPASGNQQDVTDNSLVADGPPEVVLSYQPQVGVHDNVTVGFQVRLEDTVQTSNFDYTLKRNGSTIFSGSQLGVGTPGVLVTETGIAVQNLTNSDVFTLEVQASGNQGSSAPQVSGASDATSITINYDLGRGGDVRFIMAANNVSPQTYARPVSDVEGGPVLWQLADQIVVDSSEFTITIEVDPYVVLTVDEPKVELLQDGWDVGFGTAPPLGALVIIRDGSYVAPGEVESTEFIMGPGRAGEVYEIPSPWSAAEVEDLHYVQANDIMYLVHERHHPRTLSRYGLYDWRVEQPDLNSDGSYTNPDKPAWADPSYDPLLGFPRTVTFFQQRLIFGGTESEPQTLWGSRVADFNIFGIPAPGSTTENDIPVKLTIAAQTQEAIQWLASSRAMFIGTTGNEHRVTVNSFLAVDNLPDVTRQSQYGSRNIQPEFIGTAVIFVQGSGREVRNYDLDRNANVESYDSINLAWLSEHITETGVVALSYWRTPFSILWAIRADGVLLSMTYDPSVVDLEEELLPVGWARHVTEGFFTSVATIPADDHSSTIGVFHQDRDEPWFIVDRDVGGTRKRIVEYMPTQNYLDSMLNLVVDPPTNAFGGATHLAGNMADVLVDGAVHPPVQVDAAGNFLLNYPGNDVRIGHRFTSVMKTSKWDQGNPSGSGQAATQRWSEIVARLDLSAIPKINGQQPPLRHPSTPMNTAEPLFTGDVKVNNLGLDKEGAITVVAEKPYACHLLALFGQMGINAG